jgi:hypothetical protein
MTHELRLFKFKITETLVIETLMIMIPTVCNWHQQIQMIQNRKKSKRRLNEL